MPRPVESDGCTPRPTVGEFRELYSFTRQHRTALGFESSITIGTVELAEGPRVLVEVRGAYESLRIGTDVRVVVTEYEREYDRGALSGYPMFVARPE